MAVKLYKQLYPPLPQTEEATASASTRSVSEGETRNQPPRRQIEDFAKKLKDAIKSNKEKVLQPSQQKPQPAPKDTSTLRVSILTNNLPILETYIQKIYVTSSF